MFITRRRIIEKIDPELLNPAGMNKQDLYRVILYAKDYAQCRRRLEQLGVHVLRELPIISGYVVDVPGNAVIRLAECQGVSYIAADVETEIQMNVASRVVAADKLHRKRITGKGVCIAIIDTGIYPHYDFLRPTNRIKAFVDLTDEKGKQEPYDDNGHGTFVAGVAAGNGFQSRGKYQGIAPEADIVVIRAMNKNGRGSTGNVLAAMQWIADNKDRYGIKVLSLSLGSAASNLQRDDAMIRGAEALWDMGITVVVAAGNNGPESQTITVPGVSNKIITVGALDDRRTIVIDDDGIADFSSRGPVGRRIKPDLVAPGVKVQSVKSDLEYRPGGRIRSGIPQYARMSGTSVATPIVAGIVALLLQQRPDMTPDQVKKWLLDHTVPITRDEMAEGKGLIRCE